MQCICVIYFNLFLIVLVSGDGEKPETNETEYANKPLFMSWYVNSLFSNVVESYLV
jgi:hypothetical protein